MAISRFQSRFKTRTDLMDNITPNNVVQMNASVPAGEWKPASWLPTVWQNEKSKDYFTISSGKVVSFDASGRIVPSGLLRRCLDAADKDATVLSYDANDKEAKVIDIQTGEFVTGAKDVSLKQLIDAAIAHGWIHEDVSANSDAVYVAAAKQFISAPVGVAAYDVYVWAGDDPANLHFTNYQKQHLIQFFSDVQMRVGHICESTASNVFGSTKQTAEQLNALVRYSHLLEDSSDVMAYNYGSKLASNTSRTPVTLTTAAGAWVGRERSDISLLAKKGDWYIDGDGGRIFFWEDGGDAADPVDANNQTLTALTAFDYSASVSAQEKMMHLVGPAKPGDLVTFDTNSNFKVLAPFVLADSALAANDVVALKTELDRIGTAVEDRNFEESLVVGRVYELQKEPRGLLERVRTGFNGSEFDKTAQMPGSATKGFSDLITLSDEIISDEIAIINVKVQ